MIQLDNLTYSYTRYREVLRDITADIFPGVYILLGENGVGKTTLLHLMAGLLKPQFGACMIDGKNVAKRQPLTMEHVFFLGDGMTFPVKTLEEMSRIHALFYPTFSREMLESNLDKFGLKIGDNLEALSQGNRHKAQVAYALSLRVPLLLLDEPANALDITSRDTLARMMAECVQPEQTVIVSTHTVGDLEALYDGILVLNQGRLILNVPTERVIERLAVKASPTPIPDAIYQRQRMGMYEAILEAEPGEETAINIPLLYLALASRAKDKIINVLK